MSDLNYEAFRQTTLQTDPFPYLHVAEFISSERYPTLSAEFPSLTKPGSFPLSELKCSPDFAQFIAELQGPEMAQVFSEKFDFDLTDFPTMVTIRGMCREKDGKIHSDSRTKVLTVLIYMNDQWNAEGGRLRLLHDRTDINACIAEYAPGPGAMLAFLNTENAWHGHTSFAGQRRAIQLNWVTGDDVVKHEQRRHRFAAKLKKLNPFV